jgi:hypothetical protein
MYGSTSPATITVTTLGRCWMRLQRVPRGYVLGSMGVIPLWESGKGVRM